MGNTNGNIADCLDRGTLKDESLSTHKEGLNKEIDMANLFKLGVIMIACYFGYQHWFAAFPLEEYRLTSVPVTLDILPAPKVSRTQNNQVDFELLDSQHHQDNSLTMLVMSYHSSMDRFEAEDLEFLPYEIEKYSPVGNTFGGLNAMTEESIIDRGYINTDGVRGYQLVMKLEPQQINLIQHIYIVDEHLLVLMAGYQSEREEKTAKNFLNSVQFL
ncbi:hypothetical protein [Shewanella colwelliana]|uniref:hypothetical protein n=1 Tax=Shewanella colwelliana TaxID=23 RepID=UPI0022B06B00|nr:hypothetical protein [Shewanella colwelliana]MCZ4337139.1 hypothetical protein [Shewanella colwelliana]MDX1279956.1 hypothetical protein [Shewanella colwelliana]